MCVYILVVNVASLEKKRRHLWGTVNSVLDKWAAFFNSSLIVSFCLIFLQLESLKNNPGDQQISHWLNLIYKSKPITFISVGGENKRGHDNLYLWVGLWSTCGIMLSSEEEYSAIWVQILNKAVCISQSTNILKDSMNPTIFPSTMGK